VRDRFAERGRARHERAYERVVHDDWRRSGGALAFPYLESIEAGREGLDQNIASWNQIAGWLKQLDGLRVAALRFAS
jgi:hypothetical protein